MNATQQLHDLGQSLWLDNITRSLLSKSWHALLAGLQTKREALTPASAP